MRDRGPFCNGVPSDFFLSLCRITTWMAMELILLWRNYGVRFLIGVVLFIRWWAFNLDAADGRSMFWRHIFLGLIEYHCIWFELFWYFKPCGLELEGIDVIYCVLSFMHWRRLAHDRGFWSSALGIWFQIVTTGLDILIRVWDHCYRILRGRLGVFQRWRPPCIYGWLLALSRWKD